MLCPSMPAFILTTPEYTDDKVVYYINAETKHSITIESRNLNGIISRRTMA